MIAFVFAAGAAAQGNGSAPAQAEYLQPDSARECAICHYNWVDTFYVDNSTATDIADLPAQAAAATGEMCFSCHDGSTVDSRKRAFNDRMHKPGTTPPAGMRIPDVFPLDSDGKLYCGTCHSAHGVPSEPGIEKTIFLRTTNTDSSMCMMCHAASAGGVAKGNHPLGETDADVPQELAAYGAHGASSPRRIICETCHVAHGGFSNMRLVLPVDHSGTVPGLCETCHRKMAGTGSPAGNGSGYPHPVNVALRAVDRIPGKWKSGAAVFVGAGNELVCRTCHRSHNAVQHKSLLVDHNRNDALCTQCHARETSIAGSRHDLLHSAEGTAQPPAPSSVGESGVCAACHQVHRGYGDRLAALIGSRRAARPGELCLNCHSGGGMAEKVVPKPFSHPQDIAMPGGVSPTGLPLYDDTGISRSGLIRCSTCHVFHNPLPDIDSRADGGHSSYLRIDRVGTAQLCLQCHPRQGLVQATEHDLAVTAPDFVNAVGRAYVSGNVCLPCHASHGAARQKFIWAGPLGPDMLNGWQVENVIAGDAVTMMCNGCHSPGNCAAEQIPVFGLHPKGFRVPDDDFARKQPGINFEMVKNQFPIFTPDGEVAEKGNIVCSTCHNPHQWDPRQEAAGPGQNLEGDATNSFLRPNLRANFCAECHGRDSLIRYKYFHSRLGRGNKKGAFPF